MEKGGTNKLKAAILKNLDKKNVNLEDVKEEIPDFINDLPYLIDSKLEENEKKRKEEEIREKIEENELRNDDEVFLPPIVTGYLNGEAQNINPNRVNYAKYITNNFGYPKEEEERRRGSIIDKFQQVVSPRRGSIGPSIQGVLPNNIINLKQAESSNTNTQSQSSSQSSNSQSSSSQSYSKSSQNESKFNKKNKKNKNNKKNKKNKKIDSDDESESEESEDDDDVDDESDYKKKKKNKNVGKKGKKKIYRLASTDANKGKKGKNIKKKGRKIRTSIQEEDDESESDD